ncbi:MAG: SBBP repeat-containing protein [Promethearchaeota archaeon]
MNHRSNQTLNNDHFSTDSKDNLESAASILPSEEWSISYASPSSDDYSDSSGIVIDSNDDIYNVGTFGQQMESPPSNYTLFKTDKSGNPIWNITGASTVYDEGVGVAVDFDDNVLFTGVVDYQFGTNKLFVAKYNKSKDLEWFETWGTNSNNEKGNDIVVDSVGNSYITGTTTSWTDYDQAALVLKFNRTGDLKWNYSYDIQSESDFGTGIDIDEATGDIFISGLSIGTTTRAWLMKCNSTGDKKWQKFWYPSYNGYGMDVKVDSIGNIVMIGRFWNGSNYNLFLTKYGSFGYNIWNQTWSYSDITDDGGEGLFIGKNDDIYITGYTNATGDDDVLISKYSKYGFLQWNMTWRGGSLDDKGLDITLDSSGNLYISGYLDSEQPVMADFNAKQFILKLTNKLDVSIITPTTTTYGPQNLLINASIYSRISTVSGAKAMIGASTPFNLTMRQGIGNFETIPVPGMGPAEPVNLLCVWDNVSQYTSGDYTITICAFDDYGNINQTENVVVTINASQSNNAPNIPINFYPSHGYIQNETDIFLSVSVSDPDEDVLSVAFYNASDDSLISSGGYALSGNIVSTILWYLTPGVTYDWYVVVSDGQLAIQSATWTFSITESIVITDADGIYEFSIDTKTQDVEFNVSVDVTDDTKLYFIGVDVNPTDTPLDNDLVYIELSFNDSNNIDGFINFSIKYDISKYKNIQIWWFNKSANGGLGAWEKIDFTDLGNGYIEVSVDHASVFAITAVKSQTGPPTLPGGDDDDGSSDDEQIKIFGYELVLTLSIIIIISAIFIQKKRNRIIIN